MFFTSLCNTLENVMKTSFYNIETCQFNSCGKSIDWFLYTTEFCLTFMRVKTLTPLRVSEAYPEPCQAPKMECSKKILTFSNGF